MLRIIAKSPITVTLLGRGGVFFFFLWGGGSICFLSLFVLVVAGGGGGMGGDSVVVWLFVYCFCRFSFVVLSLFYFCPEVTLCS